MAFRIFEKDGTRWRIEEKFEVVQKEEEEVKEGEDEEVEGEKKK